MNDLTLNIHIISRLTHNHYAREFRKFHLTMGQFPFVLGIARNDGISQEKLSEELRISKSTTAAIIQQLLAKGCVTRETDEADRRNFKLHLTEKGRGLLPKIQQVIDDCHRRVLQDLPAKTRSEFLAKIDQVRERTERELSRNSARDK